MTKFNLSRFRSDEGLNRLYETNPIIKDNLDFIEHRVNSGQWTKNPKSIQLFEYMNSLVDKQLANEQLWVEVTTKQKLLMDKEIEINDTAIQDFISNLKKESDRFLNSMTEFKVRDYSWTKKAKHIYLLEFVIYLLISVGLIILKKQVDFVILFGTVFFMKEFIVGISKEPLTFKGFLRITYLCSVIIIGFGTPFSWSYIPMGLIALVPNLLLIKKGRIDEETDIDDDISKILDFTPRNVSRILNYQLPNNYLLEIVVFYNRVKKGKIKLTKKDEELLNSYFDETLEKIQLIRNKNELI